ncbi:hypothetical protein LUZ63_006944 [Rhynchospora breviuscula]|uniref:Integrase catalytic domain-containing protein n=1 Tax=Rhynchospora breviuscula TaxID=2022672 RepID=A0A9Q0CQR9_9POAL|nr:hypothetical protein LUZ63_006944 [Rhynchospora breviuscula]
MAPDPLNPSSSSISTPSSTISSLSPDIIPLTIPIATKLTHTNYLTWKSQILPLLHGYNLARFLDSAPPPSTITTDSGVLAINPDYLPWHRQDQLLLGWIRSSLTESIQAQVVSCTTSMDLWSYLERVYASTSRARVTDLRRQVQFATKGAFSCTEFLQHLRQLADELAFAGSPLSDEELVQAVITGLGSDYLAFVTAITTTPHRISFADLHGMLLTHESILKNNHSSSLMATPSAFQTGQIQNNKNRPILPHPITSNNQNQYRPITSQFRPNTPSTATSSPQGNRSSSPVSKGPCQICTKANHSAKVCYFRYEPDPVWKPRPPQAARQAFATHLQPPTTSSSDWVLDSGATNHVTSDLNNLSAFFAYPGADNLQIGNGNGLKILHLGSVSLNLAGFSVQLHDVLHVPSFSKNLISLSKLLIDNPHLTISFSSSICEIKVLHTKISLPVPDQHGLYLLHATSVSPQAFLGVKTTANSWHARLGHPSTATTLQVLSSNKLPCNSNKVDMCHDCAVAKSHELPFFSSSSSSTSPLEIVYSDVWGPSPIVSSNGNRYYIIFVDEFTRFTWIYFLKQKSDVLHIFSIFKAQAENLLNTTIKILRTDNGTEYKPIGTKFSQITHQTTCPYTPQQNGISERKHRHIIELSLATMSYASIPSIYWDEIFSSIVYLINRLPASTSSSIPYTSLFHKPPDYSFLRILGCKCFPHTRPYNSHKLEMRAVPCIFIGYALSQKGYRCLDLKTNKVYVSRHVQFDESVFPFKELSLPSKDQLSTVSDEITPLLQLAQTISVQNFTETLPRMPIISNNVDHPTDQLSPTINTTPTNGQTNQSLPLHSPDCTIPQSTATDLITSSQPSPSNTTLAPSTLQTASHAMTTRTRDNTRKKRHFPDYVAFTTTLGTEPTCFTKANTIPEWREAMATEINALARNNTWKLVPPPTNHKIIGCKWVYKLKHKPDGSVERYKARLVAKGYHQEEGIDFFDTFSPVVRPTTIRLILSLAVSSHWPIRQLDVHNAFLHGDLQEQVYMSQPPGFLDIEHPDYVCLLSKSLYGLKQAPRAWFQKLSSALLAIGFSASNYDPSLFIANHNSHTLLILVYVDDILVTGSSSSMISTCIAQLQEQFSLKDLGPLHYFLGIEAVLQSDGLLLTQTKYIKDLLLKTKMHNAKSCTTPIATYITLSKEEGEPFDDPHLYRSVVGALQYATLTRPDISYAVNKVSQFMQSPTIIHWTAVKRILRYLCGTPTHGLLIHSSSSLAIHAYSDSDWAGCPDDRRSTSGFCIYLGSNLISWSAKKQPTVSRSSTEAEYRSLALTCTEILWLQYLLQEINVNLPNPPTLWCDNIGATFLASNPMFHARTKHIEIDYHFVRERIAAQELRVLFICSKDQIADVMTKPLSTNRFTFLRNKLNVFTNTLVCGGGIAQDTGSATDQETQERLTS